MPGEGPGVFFKQIINDESASRHFQQGEGPCRGLLRALWNIARSRWQLLCVVTSHLLCSGHVARHAATLASAAPCPLTNTSRASTCGLNSFLLIQVITIHHLLYYNHNFRYLIPKLIHFITGKFLKYSIKDITLIITFHTLPPHRYTYVVFRRHVLCRCGLQSNVLRFSGAPLWSLSIVIITIL